MLAPAFLLAACGADSIDDGSIGLRPVDADVIVGSGSSLDSELLAYIYAGAIRSTGTSVAVHTEQGGRSGYLAALDAGKVDLIPDYTGALLTEFDSLSTATEADDVFVDLNKSLPEGLSVGDYALAEDRTAIAVAADGPFAGLTSLTEIASQCAETTVGVTGDPPRPDPLSIESAVGSGYGCSFTEFKIYPDARAAVDALDSGEVGALAVTTASFGPLAADLITLDDDGAFSAQNVVPLLRNGSLDDGAFETLSVVAGELTTADLAEMIGEARSGGNSDDIAARWLGEHNL